jgi:tetratricopeptide (TPR) repeat protein
MLFIFILAIISAIYTIPAADITISGSENTFKKISFFSISAILLIIGTINIPQKIMYLPGYICWSKGLKYSTTYQWDKAVKSYKQAAATIKDNGKLNFDLGYVYLMSGMYKQAVEELNKAEKAFGDKNIYLFKAMAYHEMHNYTMAIDNYKILIGMFPNLLKPKLQLSKLYIEQKDIKSAEPLLVSIIESTPKIQNNAATEIKNEARKLLKTINYEKNTDY